MTRQFCPNEAMVSIFRCLAEPQDTNNICCGIFWFIQTNAQFTKSITIQKALNYLNAGSENIKEGATLNKVMKSTLDAAVTTVVGTTVDQVSPLRLLK